MHTLLGCVSQAAMLDLDGNIAQNPFVQHTVFSTNFATLNIHNALATLLKMPNLNPSMSLATWKQQG